MVLTTPILCASSGMLIKVFLRPTRSDNIPTQP
jgi:hypothetical protein